jgi:predicted ATPase/DNA-binding winged helix-turn-helix (wHTH) protein
MLHIDHTRREARWRGRTLSLNDRAFDLLVLLARQPGDLVTTEVLERALWRGRLIDSSNLRAQVSSLRRQLGVDAVRTVTGRGYMLTLPMAVQDPQADAPAARGSVRGVLPRPPDLLIGRDGCLHELSELLTRHRLVAVLGPGGIGKTRVALELAHQAAAVPMVSLLIWVDLAALTAVDTSLVDLCRAVAESGGLQWDLPADTVAARHLGRVLQHSSGDTDALLVLDNAEHLLPLLASLLPDLLAASPSLRALVTSQHALPLSFGQALWLPPLALPYADADSPTIGASPAVQLLLRRAQALHPHWQPAGEDWPAIGALVRSLDGLALALELAAPLLPLLGASALQAGLVDRLLQLGQHGEAAPRRQRTLQAALAWSYGLLPAAEQSALCQLTVFAAPFRFSAAVALLQADGRDPADAEAAIQRLVEHSMLQLLPAGPRGAPTRLRLAETTRVFALQALQAGGPVALAACARRHSQVLAGLARQASLDIFTASDAAWQACWGPDHTDLQRAFDHAHVQGDPDTAADIIEVLVLGANVTGWVQPALQRWQATRDLASDAAPLARAKLLGWGNLARAPGVGRFEQSTRRVQAWRQVDGEGGRRGLCVALAMHAAVCQDHDDMAAADDALNECQALESLDWPPRQRRRGTWYALTRLAVARNDAALLSRAGRLSERLADELQRQGAWREYTLVQGQQALMLRLRGRSAVAAELLAQAANTQLQLGCGLDAGRSMGLQSAALAELLDAAAADGQPADAALLQHACNIAARALDLLAPYPALIIEFVDSVAGLAARSGEPELAMHLLAGAAQLRQLQQKVGNQLSVRAAHSARQQVQQQLDADALRRCELQGQELSADQLRLLALRRLATD